MSGGSLVYPSLPFDPLLIPSAMQKGKRNMKGYDPRDAQSWILSRLDKKALNVGAKELPEMIADFIEYDLHFMRVTGVLDADDCQGENEYDEDEAFEFIYDAYLSDHPQADDGDMAAAAALDQYMALQAQYLSEHGLAE